MNKDHQEYYAMDQENQKFYAKALVALLIAGLCYFFVLSIFVKSADAKPQTADIVANYDGDKPDILTETAEIKSTLKEQTALLVAIKESIEAAAKINSQTVKGQEVIESTKTGVVDSDSATPVSKRREWYLVSETWCRFCPDAKKAFLDKGWPEENILTNDQCFDKFGFRVPHVPYEFGEPIKTTNAVVSHALNTNAVVSQKDLIAIHNQIHGGGSWTWKGDLATHLKNEHGYSAGGQPVQGSIFPNPQNNQVIRSRTPIRSFFLWPFGNRRARN